MGPIKHVYPTQSFTLPNNKKISKWRWYSLPGFFLKIAHIWNGSVKIEAFDKKGHTHTYYMREKNFKKLQQNNSPFKSHPGLNQVFLEPPIRENVQALITDLANKGVSDNSLFNCFKESIKKELQNFKADQPITINFADAIECIPFGVTDISLLLPAALFEAIEKNDYAIIGTDKGYIVYFNKDSAEEALRKNNDLDPNKLYHKGNLVEEGKKLLT